MGVMRMKRRMMMVRQRKWKHKMKVLIYMKRHRFEMDKRLQHTIIW